VSKYYCINKHHPLECRDSTIVVLQSMLEHTFPTLAQNADTRHDNKGTHHQPQQPYSHLLHTDVNHINKPTSSDLQ